MKWEHFQHDSPVMLALLATLFTWFVTALGAALIFFFRNLSRTTLNAMLGFSAGVMLAASYWSLLKPCIEISLQNGGTGWLPAVSGFLTGGFFIFLMDRYLPHVHFRFKQDQSEGIKTRWHRIVLLISAITLHNIPEGLAVGVAFGSLYHHPDASTFQSAVLLALGIGLQNFPEGAAVSFPLMREGLSRKRSFFYGQLSGMVEPLAGVSGAWLVSLVYPLLPFALAFAAGAMIYVVIEEIIPEAQSEGSSDVSTLGAMSGFSIMMFLDVFFS
jgi:ZIP family zinc transporter